MWLATYASLPAGWMRQQQLILWSKRRKIDVESHQTWQPQTAGGGETGEGMLPLYGCSNAFAQVHLFLPYEQSCHILRKKEGSSKLVRIPFFFSYRTKHS